MLRSWKVLGILLLCVACTVLGSPQDKRRVAVQEWLETRGPVVPHDTFPVDCMSCHEGGGWHTIRADFRFDHEKETGVVLNGAHKQAECLRCHNDRGSVADFSGQGCIGCHEEWHQGQLGSNCAACHDEMTWKPKGVVSEHAMTRFPLIGAHAGTACWACHPGSQVGKFKRASTECAVCHRADLARATVPDHQGNGWTTRCQRCHSPIGWQGASFVHDIYPLTGAHKMLPCTSCHVNNVFKGTPRDCMACHSADYTGTTDPNHQSAGFGTSCESCHNTSTWNGANFTHSYPLTGAHKSTSCNKCHINKVYVGTPRDCASCHIADYNGTTNPNHQQATFPTTCETCHNTSTWKGATFTHSFPRVKDHNVSCATCHNVPGNYQVFTCLVCHDHNKTKMDDKHKGEKGYSYSSPACLNCHPNGKN